MSKLEAGWYRVKLKGADKPSVLHWDVNGGWSHGMTECPDSYLEGVPVLIMDVNGNIVQPKAKTVDVIINPDDEMLYVNTDSYSFGGNFWDYDHDVWITIMKKAGLIVNVETKEE